MRRRITAPPRRAASSSSPRIEAPEKNLTLRLPVRTCHEPRIVLFFDGYGHLDRVAEIPSLEPGARGVYLLGAAVVLAQQSPHVTEPMPRPEHPERALAEQEIHPQRVIGGRSGIRERRERCAGDRPVH